MALVIEQVKNTCQRRQKCDVELFVSLEELYQCLCISSKVKCFGCKGDWASKGFKGRLGSIWYVLFCVSL